MLGWEPFFISKTELLINLNQELFWKMVITKNNNSDLVSKESFWNERFKFLAENNVFKFRLRFPKKKKTQSGQNVLFQYFNECLKSMFITYIIFLNFCQIISRYIVNYDETNKMKLKQRPELYWICYYLSIYLSQKLVPCLLIP